MATASLIKANNPFLVTWKPSFLCGLSSHKSVPNSLCFIKPAKFTGLSINYSNSKKATHRAASASPFNFDGRSPKKNYFQLAYCAILQTLKTLKNRTVSFVLLVWLSMMQFVDEISKLTTRSVLKIQVGLWATKGSLRRDFKQIAKTADIHTHGRDGWMYIFKESIQSLLQRSDYFISGRSSVNVDGIRSRENRFRLMFYKEERGEFGEETLIDINNMKMKSIINQKAKESSNEYLVITIQVVATGVNKLPVINSSEDLKEALQKLCSIRMWQIEGFQVVLWWPQNENDAPLE